MNWMLDVDWGQWFLVSKWIKIRVEKNRWNENIFVFLEQQLHHILPTLSHNGLDFSRALIQFGDSSLVTLKIYNHPTHLDGIANYFPSVYESGADLIASI